MNKDCFEGMDSATVVRIFGWKHVTDQYQNRSWMIHYPVSIPGMNVYELFYTLDFQTTDGKVIGVFWSEVSPGEIKN